MNIYLIKIYNRPYGFTVVALVAKDEEAAKVAAREKWPCYFGTWNGPEYKPNHSHAEVVDQCSTAKKSWCSMEFQE